MAPQIVQQLVNETDRLQDEIRHLEREYNTLVHKSSIISESCQRGYNETEDLRRDTARVEADIREVMGRDVAAAASLAARQESGRLLAGLEIQARTALDEEVKRTREQRASMQGSINSAMMKAKEMEEKMMKIGAYREVKELEERVDGRLRELDAMKLNRGGVRARPAMLREDDSKWKLFQKWVVEVAKAGRERDIAQVALMEKVRAVEEMKMMEKRRRMEQQGTVRLEKVSSEVDRIERVVCEKNPWRMNGSEKPASQDGGFVRRDSGTATNSGKEGAMRMSSVIEHDRAQDGGRGSSFPNSQCGISQDMFAPTPPIYSLPPARRALGVSLKMSNSVPRKNSSNTQVSERQGMSASTDMLRTLPTPESPPAPLGQTQGLEMKNADDDQGKLSIAPPHLQQIVPSTQDHMGTRDIPMQSEEKDCSHTQGAGSSLLSQYGSSASMLSTPTSPSHYVPPTPRRLGVQLKLSTTLLKNSPSSCQVDQEQGKKAMATEEATATAPIPEPAVEQLSNARQDQERILPGKEQVALTTGIRLPLPRLKSLVPSIIQELNVKPTMIEDVNHTPTSMLQKVGDPEHVGVRLTTAGQVQGERQDLEARAYDVKTVRAAPKSNIFGRLGAGLFKKSKDMEVRTSLTSVEENYQQHHTNHLMSTSSGSMAIEEALGTGGSMSPHPSKINMEQSHEREDAIICQSNSSSAHVEAISPKETEALSSDSTEAEASCFQQTATADLPKPPELADGGEEDHDEEEEYIDAESGQVVDSCEGEGNAGGEMQEGEIVEKSKPLASASSSAATTPGKRRLPPLQFSPGTALNDSKREAALKDLMADSQEEHFSRFPKAPRLDPKSPEREICQVDGDGAEKIGNVSVPFNIAELEQPGNLKPDDLPTSSSCAASSNDGQASKEGSVASKDFFGAGGDDGFNFNFGDNSLAEESFSFFGGGGGDAKSPDKEEKNDNFFLNFDGGEGDKEEEGSGWNFFS